MLNQWAHASSHLWGCYLCLRRTMPREYCHFVDQTLTESHELCACCPARCLSDWYWSARLDSLTSATSTIKSKNSWVWSGAISCKYALRQVVLYQQLLSLMTAVHVIGGSEKLDQSCQCCGETHRWWHHGVGSDSVWLGVISGTDCGGGCDGTTLHEWHPVSTCLTPPVTGPRYSLSVRQCLSVCLYGLTASCWGPPVISQVPRSSPNQTSDRSIQ